jgi:hypothetical protein
LLRFEIELNIAPDGLPTLGPDCGVNHRLACIVARQDAPVLPGPRPRQRPAGDIEEEALSESVVPRDQVEPFAEIRLETFRRTVSFEAQPLQHFTIVHGPAKDA